MKYRDLPLSALRSFAVASEWSNFTLAAEELGVTHGAISRQVQLLEKWMGTELFVRQGRGLVLTPAGQALARQLNMSFSDIAASCADIRRSGRRFVVTVECPTTLAMYWLMPRLAVLEAKLRNVEINLVTRMSDERQDRPNSDIVITRGQLKGVRRIELVEKPLLVEEMGLIAAPEFFERYSISGPSDVPDLPMVASVTRPNDWPEWFRQAGLSMERLRFRQSFEHSFIALNAVRCGIGTMVAPRNIFLGSHFVSRFQTPLPDIRFVGETYYLNHRARLPSTVIKVCHALLDLNQARSAQGDLS